MKRAMTPLRFSFIRSFHVFGAKMSASSVQPVAHRCSAFMCQDTVLSGPSQQSAILTRQFSTQKRFRNNSNPGKAIAREVEASELIVNLGTGEKMPMMEYSSLAKKQVLRILLDGSKEEMTLQDALKEAQEIDLDAVLVSREADQLVVKLMDYAKIRHEHSKKLKDNARKCVTVSMKELRLGLNIGQHDLDRLMKQAKEFLEKGNPVKLFIKLRGAAYYNCQEQACQKIDEISKTLSEYATRDKNASLLGNVASVLMVPLPKKAKTASPGSSAGKSKQADVQMPTKTADKSNGATLKPQPPIQKDAKASPAVPARPPSDTNLRPSSEPKPKLEISRLDSREERIIICSKVGQVSTKI